MQLDHFIHCYDDVARLTLTAVVQLWYVTLLEILTGLQRGGGSVGGI